MCRLFGAISNHSVDAEYLVSAAPQSLLKQSHIDRKRLQSDGWGVGWFDGSRPRVQKSPKPMYRDRKKVQSAALQAKGRVLIGHVRWASNPLKLKRSDLIGLAHTQPFVHKNWIFAHNGTLYIPKEVAAQLGPWRKHIKGKNDSEVLFYWLLKHIKGKNFKNAIRNSIRGIHKIWATCKKSYPIHPYPYHGLNWVLSNGKIFLAFCYTDPRGFGKSKALCNSKESYYRLRRQISKDHVLVASEPMDESARWEGFRHGELLKVERRRERLITSVSKVL